MAFKLADFIKETVTNPGSAAFDLNGAVSTYFPFSGYLADGDATWYFARLGAQWEAGIGTYVAATDFLNRTTLIGSSSGAFVTFLTGQVAVSCGLPAEMMSLVFALLINSPAASPAATVAQQKIALSGLGAWDPGDAKLTFRATPTAGWFFCDDGSIGDALSGATTRANADTADCFAALYAITSLTVQDTTGATVGRGANAAADYAAHRRLLIPKTLGRAIAVAGSGSGLTARALGTTAGAETETPTVAKTASHFHSQFLAAMNTPPPDLASTSVVSGASGGAGIAGSATTGNQGGGTPLNIISPEFFMNIAIKL